MNQSSTDKSKLYGWIKYLMMLEKNKYYRVKVIDHDNEKLIGKKVKIKYTGIFLTGKDDKNKLYLYQVEILEEITEEEFGNDK